MLTKSKRDESVFFRPDATAVQEITLAIDAMACYIHSSKVTYIAVPITGGPRFLEWFSQQGESLRHDSVTYAQALRKNVIAPNTFDAERAIARILSSREGHLINPASLVAPAWTQDDYRFFWSHVIERFVDEAVFLDGWHLSSGCIYEFYIMESLKIPVFDERQTPLSLHAGLNQIQDGVRQLKSINADTNFIEQVVSHLVPRKTPENGTT